MNRPPILMVSPQLRGDERLEDLAGFARAAEAAGFDILRLAPCPGFDPLSAAACLASVTSRIGLCAAAWTGIGEPYTLARGFAALDHLSGGRAAWQVLPNSPPDLPPFPHRRAIAPQDENLLAQEFVCAVDMLWRSWGPDALLHDKAEARFSDPAQIRITPFDGRFIHSRGPLNTPRPPQGRPLLVVDDAAGAAEASADLLLVTTPGKAPDGPLRILKISDPGLPVDADGLDLAVQLSQAANLATIAAHLSPRRPAAGATLRTRLQLGAVA